jgi:hypothetical protein
MEQSAGSTSTVGLSGTTPKAAAHVNKYSGTPHQKARTTQGHIHVKPTFFFFFVSHKAVGSPEPTWQKKQSKIGLAESSETLFTCCAPTSERFPCGNWGRLTQHNFWENIKEAKGNECIQYKSRAAIFSSSLHFCTIHIFSSRFDSTMGTYTKGALLLSCCTFSLYYFLNFAFTVFQVNILIMVSLLGAHCYSVYCTLLGGQFNIHKLPNLQLHIVKSPFSHLHFYIANLTSLHDFTGCPKFSDCPKKICWLPNLFLKFFSPKLCFFGLFYKIKNSKSYKLIITNCKCAFASVHMQVHKFASLQIYKVKKSTNYKLIIINFQLVCKF